MPFGYAGSIMHPQPSSHILFVTPRSRARVSLYHRVMVIPVWAERFGIYKYEYICFPCAFTLVSIFELGLLRSFLAFS